MKSSFIILLLSAATTYAAITCPEGYFSTDDQTCNSACSDGCPNALCESDTGACTDPSRCEAGWTNSGSDKNDCAAPICFGGRPCAEGGECVGPNMCICGKSGAQVVAKVGTFSSKDGADIAGTDCVSLRKDGIMGALVALIVMSVSITICGTIAEKGGQAR